jgi:hypothetical protein
MIAAVLASTLLVGGLRQDEEVIGRLGQAVADCKMYQDMDVDSKVLSSARAFQYLVVRDASSPDWKKILLINQTLAYVRRQDIVLLPYNVTVKTFEETAAAKDAPAPETRIAPTKKISLSYVVGRYRTEPALLAAYIPNPSEDEIEKFGTKVRLSSNRTFTIEASGTKWSGTYTFNGEEARLFLSVTHRDGKKAKSEATLIALVRTNGVKKYLAIPDLMMWFEKY